MSKIFQLRINIIKPVRANDRTFGTVSILHPQCRFMTIILYKIAALEITLPTH